VQRFVGLLNTALLYLDTGGMRAAATVQYIDVKVIELAAKNGIQNVLQLVIFSACTAFLCFAETSSTTISAEALLTCRALMCTCLHSRCAPILFQVHAGSIAQSGMIEVRAAAVGDSTLYGRVTAVVRSAAEHRAPVESLADAAAKAIVVFAFVSSGATLALTGSATNAVSVLVVAGTSAL
jgi:E1-E2 ATPase